MAVTYYRPNVVFVTEDQLHFVIGRHIGANVYKFRLLNYTTGTSLLDAEYCIGE